MPNEWRPLMNDWLATHAGVITAEQLRSWGCPRRQVTRLVERLEKEPIFGGVYRSAHWPLGKEQKLLAACLVNPNVIIARTSAAEYWGFRRMPHGGGRALRRSSPDEPTADAVRLCRHVGRRRSKLACSRRSHARGYPPLRRSSEFGFPAADGSVSTLHGQRSARRSRWIIRFGMRAPRSRTATSTSPVSLPDAPALPLGS